MQCVHMGSAGLMGVTEPWTSRDYGRVQLLDWEQQQTLGTTGLSCYELSIWKCLVSWPTD